MIDNYELKKENGLIATKELDNGMIEITESQFNPLTAKKEVVTSYTLNEQQLSNMITDNDNQADAVAKRGKSMKAMLSDMFGPRKETSK